MKVVILAAGKNHRHHWPFLIDKPKCLYSQKGRVQLEQVIEDAKQIVAEEDIIVVAGYKAQRIRQFIALKNFKISIVENKHYARSALFSLKAGLAGVHDDVLFLHADESVAVKNLKRMAEEKNGFVCLVSDRYPYYCMNAIRISADKISYFLDERYLKDDFLKDIKRFVTNNIESKQYDKSHLQNFTRQNVDIESGVALDLINIDILRRISRQDEVIKLLNKETPSEVTTIPYNEEADYIKDLDDFTQTDEYNNQVLFRSYFNWQKRCIFFYSKLIKFKRTFF